MFFQFTCLGRFWGLFLAANWDIFSRSRLLKIQFTITGCFEQKMTKSNTTLRYPLQLKLIHNSLILTPPSHLHPGGQVELMIISYLGVKGKDLI